MSIFFCDLCPLAFATQGELTLHKNQHHITCPPAFTSYQPNQGNTIAGSSYGAGIEMLIAASVVYWMSRDKRYPVDYTLPQQIKLEPSDSPPKAKRSRGASKSVPLTANGTRRHLCDECMMEFPSYHALGGHKSGHRKAEARFRAAVAQLHWVPPQPPLQPQQQPQPQEAPPPPPSSQQPKYLFDLNEPPPE